MQTSELFYQEIFEHFKPLETALDANVTVTHPEASHDLNKGVVVVQLNTDVLAGYYCLDFAGTEIQVTGYHREFKASLQLEQLIYKELRHYHPNYGNTKVMYRTFSKYVDYLAMHQSVCIIRNYFYEQF